MFRLAEAFIEFVTVGYSNVIGQLTSVGAEVQSFVAAASGASASSEGMSTSLMVLGNNATQAAGGLSLMATRVTQLRGEMIAYNAARLGGPSGVPLLSGPVMAEVVSGTASATRNMDALLRQFGPLVQGLAATRIGGPIFMALASGLAGISNAARAATASLAAMGVTLTISTGGLFAILAGIAAALLAIGVAFKSAFAADPAAQRAWQELKDGIVAILANVGGPLVEAFKAIVVPMAELVNLTERAMRGFANLTGQVMTLRASMWALGKAIEVAFMPMEAALRLLGMFAPERMSGGAGAGGGAGSRVGLEDFEKQLSAAITKDDSAKRSANALENIQREGVRIRNANEIGGNTQLGFAR